MTPPFKAPSSQIERQFGKGTVMRMGDEGAQVRVEAIPTGALSLDLALGIGGMPRGRIVEVFGPESSGKTTLVYHVIAEAQKLGGVCAFIDAEHAMDPLYARNLGVDIDELLVSQPDYGEQGLEIADMLVRSGAVDVVAIDSVAALTPRAELEGQMGDQTVGVQARMMSQAMRKLAGNLNRTQTLCLFVNQIREKVGVMFGSPETQPGGRALKFYASQRLDIRRIETLKDGTEAIGNRVRVKVVKNKVAAAVPPGGVRHRVRQGHLELGLHPRPGDRAQRGDQVRLLLLLRRRAPRPGPQQRQGLPRRAPRGGQGDRGQDLRRPRTSARISSPRSTASPAPSRRRRPSRRREAGQQRRAGKLAAVTRGSRLAPRASREHAGGRAPRCRTPRRGWSTPARWPGARSTAASGRKRSCARCWPASGSPPRTPRRCSASSPAPATSTTRATPSASRRTGGALDGWGAERIEQRLRALGVAPDVAAAAAGERSAARPSWRPRSRCCAGACPPRPTTPRERDRALGILVRKGYGLEVAHDALRRHAGVTEPDW